MNTKREYPHQSEDAKAILERFAAACPGIRSAELIRDPILDSEWQDAAGSDIPAVFARLPVINAAYFRFDRTVVRIEADGDQGILTIAVPIGKTPDADSERAFAILDEIMRHPSGPQADSRPDPPENQSPRVEFLSLDCCESPEEEKRMQESSGHLQKIRPRPGVTPIPIGTISEEGDDCFLVRPQEDNLTLRLGDDQHVKSARERAARIVAKLKQEGTLPGTSHVPPLAWMEQADDEDF
jgi:hypothetical protein